MQTDTENRQGTMQTRAQRLLSLDVMRGLIMILLAAEACQVYTSLLELNSSGFGNRIVTQFFHHPWNGLRFWDLVQPAFMLMAGAALYISWIYKSRKGITWAQNFRHVLVRCFRLFVCGVLLHCVYAGRIVWELWNVLTQLSFTTLIAYLIIRKPVWFQLVFSIGLLLLTEALYRMVLLPGFDRPFTEHQNFGAWFDTIVMGKVNSDGWVFINIIPTAAHTIWGAVAGKLLISSQSGSKKIRELLLFGLLMVLLGHALDIFGITPIIKRISTSSFTLASGGWVLLILAVLYWIYDVRGWNRYSQLFTVVGMNAIFIYLFFETVGIQWVNPTVAIFTNGILWGVGESWQHLAAALVTLALEWLLCYWLYKKKIFFKL